MRTGRKKPEGKRSNVSEDGCRRMSIWLAALVGMACGALAAALYYLCSQVLRPSPYNILLLGHAPVLMVFGGMAGLLVSAMRNSD
jgi:cobalamin synthase